MRKLAIATALVVATPLLAVGSTSAAACGWGWGGGGYGYTAPRSYGYYGYAPRYYGPRVGWRGYRSGAWRGYAYRY